LDCRDEEAQGRREKKKILSEPLIAMMTLIIMIEKTTLRCLFFMVII